MAGTWCATRGRASRSYLRDDERPKLKLASWIQSKSRGSWPQASGMNIDR